EGRKRPDPGFSFQLALPPGADREDPLKPFRDPAARARLLEPRFQDFIGTRPAARAGPRTVLSFVPVPVPGRKGATARPKATGGPAVLEWQPPAGRESGAGRLRGRVVLVTTTLNGDWNNWPPSPSYLPFVQ